ncbi:MAG: hypothetical protein V4557_02445 [Bacteroidota bacterium]
MKKMFFILLIIFTGLLAHAQTETKSNTLTPAAPVSKKIEVAKEGAVSSFETNLVPGGLTLTKGSKNGDGLAFETFYTLVRSKDPVLNNRKPIKIGLSRKSFDSVFTYVSAELSARRVQLERYVTEQKISLDTEKGWIDLVRYYNSL